MTNACPLLSRGSFIKNGAKIRKWLDISLRSSEKKVCGGEKYKSSGFLKGSHKMFPKKLNGSEYKLITYHPEGLCERKIVTHRTIVKSRVKKQNFYTRLWKRFATAKVHDGKMTKQSLLKRCGRDVNNAWK